MIKKKPIARKPTPGARKPQPRAPAPDEGAPDAPEAGAEDGADDLSPAPSRGGAEDELALQAAPEVKLSNESFKHVRPRTPATGRGSMDIEDTSKLLIAAWVVMGAVVIGAIVWLLMSSNKAPETTDVPLPPVVPPAAQADLENQRYRANFENRSAFESYLRFGQSAYREMPDASGEKLTEKMKHDVSIASVDDPDMKELYRLQLENFKLSPDHPLRAYEQVIGSVGEVKGAQSSSTLNSFQRNEGMIKGLTQKLRKRYDVKL